MLKANWDPGTPGGRLSNSLVLFCFPINCHVCLYGTAKEPLLTYGVEMGLPILKILRSESADISLRWEYE